MPPSFYRHSRSLPTDLPSLTSLPLLHPASRRLGKCHSSSAPPPLQPSVALDCPLELGPQASQNQPSNPSASSPHCLPPSFAGHPQLLLLFPICLGLILASKTLHKAIPSHGTPFPLLHVAQLRCLFTGRRLLSLSLKRCHLGTACGPGTGTRPPVSNGGSCVALRGPGVTRGCGCPQDRAEWVDPVPARGSWGHIPSAAQVPSQRSPPSQRTPSPSSSLQLMVVGLSPALGDPSGSVSQRVPSRPHTTSWGAGRGPREHVHVHMHPRPAHNWLTGGQGAQGLPALPFPSRELTSLSFRLPWSGANGDPPTQGPSVSWAVVESPEISLMCSKSPINVSISLLISSSFYQDFIFIFMAAPGVSYHPVFCRCLVNKQWSPGLQGDPGPLYRLWQEVAGGGAFSGAAQLLCPSPCFSSNPIPLPVGSGRSVKRCDPSHRNSGFPHGPQSSPFLGQVTKHPTALITTRHDAGAWATWGLESSSGRTPMDKE